MHFNSRANANAYSSNYAVVPNDNANQNVNANRASEKSAKQITRPAIEKEFYDIEERVIIRPAGKAIIEFDPHPSHQAVKAPNGNNKLYQNDRNRNNNYNNNYITVSSSTEEPQYNSAQAHILCPQDQTPGYHFADASTASPPPGQYFTTTTATPTPIYIQYQPASTTASSVQNHYSSSTPSIQYSTATAASSTTGQQESSTPGNEQKEVFVSSSTPVSVTIIESGENNNGSTNQNSNNQINNNPDIIYAKNGRLTLPSNNNKNFYGNDEDDVDQVADELPPRGDSASSNNYRASEPDQFYHEAPRGRYTNNGPYQPPVRNVQTKYNGEPTERNEYAEEIPAGRYNDQQQQLQQQQQNSTGPNSKYVNGDQNQRLIELYTGNGGVTEVGRSHAAYTSGENSDYTNNNNNNYNNNNNDNGHEYKNVGNVRARVISVTPPPENSVPSEHINTRRIVVSKYIQTVEDVDTSANGTANATGSRAESAAQINGNGNNGASSYYISTTPAPKGQRIIYVQPVSQDVAERKATAPVVEYRRN